MVPNSDSFSFKLLHNPNVGHGGCWSEMRVWFPSEREKYTGASQKGVVASGELYNISVEWSGME